MLIIMFSPTFFTKFGDFSLKNESSQELNVLAKFENDPLIITDM